MKYRRVLALHLSGARNKDIARSLKITEQYVSTILRKDEIRSICAPAYAERIEQLVPKALETLERNMECGDASAEVRAADIALKAAGRYVAPGEGAVTAEDVIERVLERISPDGTRVRATERRIISMKGGLLEAPTPSV